MTISKNVQLKDSSNTPEFVKRLFTSPQELVDLDIYSPEQLLVHTYQMYGTRVAATSSFQSQSLPLLHLISKYCPELKVFFIDTGYHFQETLVFRDLVTNAFNLNLEVIQSEVSCKDFECKQGDLYHTNPDQCCTFRKVEPFYKKMTSYDAWICGIRNEQTIIRNRSKLIEINDHFLKINPMINWTQSQIEDYIKENNLPKHPLEAVGYQSIGCWPCTKPVIPNKNPRSGRWFGFSKTECGIHLEQYSKSDKKISS